MHACNFVLNMKEIKSLNSHQSGILEFMYNTSREACLWRASLLCIYSTQHLPSTQEKTEIEGPLSTNHKTGEVNPAKSWSSVPPATIVSLTPMVQEKHAHTVDTLTDRQTWSALYKRYWVLCHHVMLKTRQSSIMDS